MKLSKEVFKSGMKDLLVFYPSWKVRFEEIEVVNKWYIMFSDMEDELFSEMICKYIKTIKFPPTVAGLLEAIKNNKSEV